MSQGTTPTTEDLGSQVEALKSDIAALTKTIAEMSKAKTSEVAGTLRSKAEAARDVGSEQFAMLEQHLVSGAETAEAYVRRNPTAALGIAAGIGVLVGLLSARR